MKKTLFAASALATLLSSNAVTACQDLTGLHVGLGFVTHFDRYEAELDTLDVMNPGGSIASWTTQTSASAIDFDQVNPTSMAQLMKQIMDAPTNADGDNQFTADVNVGTVKGVFRAGQVVKVGTQEDDTVHLVRSHKAKRRSTNCGGEIKLSYFHAFANHLMIGIDFGCVFNSKAKKHVKFAAAKNPVPLTGYELEAGGTTIATLNAAKDTATIDNVFAAATRPIETGQVYVITPIFDEDYSENLGDYEAAVTTNNTEGRAVGEISQIEQNNYLHAGDKTELTFEKNIFSPRLAFVIGGTINGWFAGVRTGISYMTGKLRGTDGTREVSKSVSISSPFIGVQVMKQMTVFGRNDAHVYLTADWNVGDGHRSVNVKNVKSYKQSNVNIALGVTWRWKFGA